MDNLMWLNILAQLQYYRPYNFIFGHSMSLVTDLIARD